MKHTSPARACPRAARLLVLALLLSTGLAEPALAAVPQEPGPDAPASWDPTAAELEEALEKWARQYVTYIITDQEKRIFESLPTPEMKLAFTERFWEIRDPTPGTSLNEYRREHFERWVTANRRFSAGKPGWSTDRGRVFIILGPPNNLQRNPTGRGPGERASEVWSYNLADNPALPGVMDLYFVDFDGTNDYELVSDLDAAAPIASAQFGYVNNPLDVYSLSRHADTIYDERFLTYRYRDPTIVAQDFLDFQDTLREILRVPEIHRDRLADLRSGVAETEVAFDALPMMRSLDFYEAVAGSTAVHVTLALEHDQLEATPVGGNLHFSADMYVALEREGLVIDAEEKRLNFSLTPEERDQLAGTQILQSFQMLVPPGDYDFVVLTRDNTAERLGRRTESLEVPALAGEGLRLSTLTLASRIQQITAPADEPPVDFQIGNMRVVPNVNRTYFPDQTLYLYVQAYGLELGAEGSNRVTLRGAVHRSGVEVRAIQEQHPFPAPLSRQSFSLALPLAGYRPGVYEVTLEVLDQVSGASRSVTADFAIVPPGPLTGSR